MTNYTIITPENAEDRRRKIRRQRLRRERLTLAIAATLYMLFGVALYWLFVGVPSVTDPWLYFYALLWWIPLAWYAFLYVMLALAVVGAVVFIWSRALK